MFACSSNDNWVDIERKSRDKNWLTRLDSVGKFAENSISDMIPTMIIKKRDH